MIMDANNIFSLIHSCQKILHKFHHLCENGIDFTDNPLHLQMLTDTEYMKNIKTDEDIKKMRKLDLVKIYEDFICTKIVSGLYCKHITKQSPDFKSRKNCVYNILTENAIAFVNQEKNKENYLIDEDELEDNRVDQKYKYKIYEKSRRLAAEAIKLLHILKEYTSALGLRTAARGPKLEVSLNQDDQYLINMSGVATVCDNMLIFVHLTFAEFLTARHFVKMCNESPPPTKDFGAHDLLKNDVTKQTLNFIENILDNDKVKPINADFTECLKEIKVFERVCKSGMSKLFSLLWKTDSDGEMVKKWIEESHAYPDEEKMGLFFLACCSSLELADKLTKWCPMLDIENVDNLVNCLAKLTNSQLVLEKALSQVSNWNNHWPKRDFFTTVSTDISTEIYEFAYSNSADMKSPDQLLRLIYENKNCSPGLLPVLLKLGLNLTYIVDESMGLRLVDTFPLHTEVLGLIVQMASQFANNDMHSAESYLFIKNLGARRPLAEEDRRSYLKYIVKCLCKLFRSYNCVVTTNLRTKEDDSAIETLAQQVDELRPLATQYKLYLIRANLSDDRNAQRMFLEVEQFIKRNLKFRCGCNLLHYACRNDNLSLLVMLKKKGFFKSNAAMVTNKLKETPLHKASKYTAMSTIHKKTLRFV